MLAKVMYLVQKDNPEAYHKLMFEADGAYLSIADIKPFNFVQVDLVDIEADIQGMESVYIYMNQLNIPQEHPKRNLFKKAGHTSMSVGDMIEFENGTRYMVGNQGFTPIVNK